MRAKTLSRKEINSFAPAFQVGLGTFARLLPFVLAEACLPKEGRLRMSLFISRKEEKAQRAYLSSLRLLFFAALREIFF
uniref:hypothetical protein n=1 Tax=Algoriphagus sp. TaxID=1872435 RepID=UPI0040479CB6